MKAEKEGKSGQGAEVAPSRLPVIVENIHGPEVYADDATFFALKGGNVSIAFSSARFDTSVVPPAVKNVIIGRLVMPAAGARNLVDGLNDYLTKQGLRPGKSGAN